ncbi:hypothetical protein HD553DRAFT_325752 [Filobasidium floriforme]|uniref:uncharacterized protein n=1 Tax=Filobasidium floriforme TaxID=5210 RepID=UPI001E8DAE29|nr:uncharacterized protein HD553DRAFT_325752 [Filobasidium floriforme]KAH8080773.1 hypothetical protein HD553DRAFT_325752 [Filobasidium floriforme]
MPSSSRPIIRERDQDHVSSNLGSGAPKAEMDWLWNPLSQKLEQLSADVLETADALVTNTFRHATADSIDTIFQDAQSCLGQLTRRTSPSPQEHARTKLSNACFPLEAEQNEAVKQHEPESDVPARTKSVSITSSALFRVTLDPSSGIVVITLQVTFQVIRSSQSPTGLGKKDYEYKREGKHKLFFDSRSSFWGWGQATVVPTILGRVQKNFGQKNFGSHSEARNLEPPSTMNVKEIEDFGWRQTSGLQTHSRFKVWSTAVRFQSLYDIELACNKPQNPGSGYQVIGGVTTTLICSTMLELDPQLSTSFASIVLIITRSLYRIASTQSRDCYLLHACAVAISCIGVCRKGEVEFIDCETAPEPREEEKWLWDPLRTELQAIATSALDLPKKLIEDTFGSETTAVDTSGVLQSAKSCLGLHTRNHIGVVVYPKLNEACEELQIRQNEILSIRSEKEGSKFENRTTQVDIKAAFLPSDPYMTESGTVICPFQVHLSVCRFFRSIPEEERESTRLHQYTFNVKHKLSLGLCVRPDQEGPSRDNSLLTGPEGPSCDNSLLTGPEGTSSTGAVSNITAPNVEGTRLDDFRADSQIYESDANTESDNESALHRLDLTHNKMPNPPPGTIVHRQGSIIWDPYMPDSKPEDELEWLWNPLRQQLEAVATVVLKRLGEECGSHFMKEKAGNVHGIRKLANEWLNEKGQEESAHEAAKMIVSPGRYPDIWEVQLSEGVCELERTAPMEAGTKKIIIGSQATFRVLREEEIKDKRQISIQLWMSFDTKRFDANPAKRVDYYAYKWRVNHDLWLERRSWRSRAASIISSVVPTVSSSFRPTRSSQATGPGHETHTEAVMRPDASCGTSLAGSTPPTETQRASFDGLLPGESDSSRRDVSDVIAENSHMTGYHIPNPSQTSHGHIGRSRTHAAGYIPGSHVERPQRVTRAPWGSSYSFVMSTCHEPTIYHARVVVSVLPQDSHLEYELLQCVVEPLGTVHAAFNQAATEYKSSPEASSPMATVRALKWLISSVPDRVLPEDRLTPLLLPARDQLKEQTDKLLKKLMEENWNTDDVYNLSNIEGCIHVSPPYRNRVDLVKADVVIDFQVGFERGKQANKQSSPSQVYDIRHHTYHNFSLKDLKWSLSRFRDPKSYTTGDSGSMGHRPEQLLPDDDETMRTIATMLSESSVVTGTQDTIIFGRCDSFLLLLDDLLAPVERDATQKLATITPEYEIKPFPRELSQNYHGQFLLCSLLRYEGLARSPLALPTIYLDLDRQQSDPPHTWFYNQEPVAETSFSPAEHLLSPNKRSNMADTSYPIRYEVISESQLNLNGGGGVSSLQRFPMTAREELKSHADRAASGVHSFLQRTFANGARFAKDLEEVEREVQRMIKETVQEKSILDEFIAEFRRGLTQVEQSSAWTTGLALQEGILKQIEIHFVEDLYKVRGDHLELYLWVVLNVFLKRPGTQNRNRHLFHGSYAYIKTFRFSLVGAPAAIEQDASTGSNQSNNKTDDVNSTVSNPIEGESILPDIATLFTGKSLGNTDLSGGSIPGSL